MHGLFDNILESNQPQITTKYKEHQPQTTHTPNYRVSFPSLRDQHLPQHPFARMNRQQHQKAKLRALGGFFSVLTA